MTTPYDFAGLAPLNDLPQSVRFLGLRPQVIDLIAGFLRRFEPSR